MEPLDRFVAARTTRLSLADGTAIVLRPVVPGDRDLFVSAFDRLSPQSRYFRFFTSVSHLSEPLLTRLTELDYERDFAWVALVGEGDDRAVAGVSRYYRMGDSPTAEAAVTVIDPYQRRGAGGLLLDALVLEAAQVGVTCFVGLVLAENHGMRTVLRQAGAQLHHQDAGTLGFSLDIGSAAAGLTASPVYAVLRAVARGEASVTGPELAGLIPPAQVRPAS